MPLSDHELIEKIRNGEKHQYAHLVHRYKDKAMTLALRMLRNREDAEEALQDAFVRAYNGLEKYRGAARFGTWFYRILYNVCLTRLGRRQNEFTFTTYDEEEYTAPDGLSTDFSTELERNDLLRILKKILETLPEKYGTVLTMFYLQELSHEEICEVAQLPLGTVKVQLFRARALLHERLLKELALERTTI